MMRASLAASLALVAAAACSAQEVGRLEPVADRGVTLATRHAADDMAALREGAVVVQVGGTWATRDASALDVTYRNAGATAVTIDPSRFGLVLGGEAATVDTVDDVTGVDVSKPDNTAIPQPLQGSGAAKQVLTVPAGATRTLLVRFRNWTRQGNRAAMGKTVVAGVPTPGGLRTVSFRCGK